MNDKGAEACILVRFRDRALNAYMAIFQSTSKFRTSMHLVILKKK